MKTIRHRFVTGLALMTLVMAALAGPSGEMLAYTCAGCHGTDGSSVGPSSPHIAGMSTEYFVESMKSYRDDERNPTIMNRIAKAYSDEQIDAMAKFFSEQTLSLTAQTVDEEQASLGADYHDLYCEKCHEEGGKKAGDDGTLAGQWMPYLKYSMDDFISGVRPMTKKMRTKLERMEKEKGPESVNAVIQFYGSYK